MTDMTSNKPQKRRITKTRNWVAVVYPESAPENWKEILDEKHIPALISPLHDKDVNPGTSDPKKAHYHVMLMYEGPKEQHIPEAVFAEIGGVGCIAVNSVRGQARYFCHMDNPEKAQYRIEDVVALNGANYSDLVQLPSDKYKVIREMRAYVKDENIVAFSDLFDYAADNREDWFNALSDNCSYVMEKYIKSRTWKMERDTMAAQSRWEDE